MSGVADMEHTRIKHNGHQLTSPLIYFVTFGAQPHPPLSLFYSSAATAPLL